MKQPKGPAGKKAAKKQSGKQSALGESPPRRVIVPTVIEATKPQPKRPSSAPVERVQPQRPSKAAHIDTSRPLRPIATIATRRQEAHFPNRVRDLLAELAQLLDWILKQLVPPLPEPCDCNTCPADPTLTCSYLGQDQYVEDAYIANAYRGNLFLTPGDARGVIGGLLHALNPPQHYSHMGIIVADHTLVRHCTCSQERLVANEYYSGSLLGIPAPLDGLNVDHVRYGWPGTITQSIYQAFFADRYGTAGIPPGYNAPYTGSMLPDWESTQNPKTSYLTNQLGFDPVSDDGQTWYPPLIVKPCPSLQTQFHTLALNGVAERALSTYAHYRFYAYSHGGIGGDPNFPIGAIFTLPDAQPDFDSSTGRWTDWATAIKWVNKETIAAVCSSFAWQMVQNAFPKRVPKIILDWADSQQQALGENNGMCVRALAPDWQADTRDQYTEDGLYFYSEDERKTVGQSLHDNLSQMVFDSLKNSLSGAGSVQKALATVIDDVGRGAFIAAAAAGGHALSTLLSPLLVPLGVTVDAVMTDKLIELLYDMPGDIANQVCNMFAFDCGRGAPADEACVDAQGNLIADVDSDNWSSAPGDGVAVSPDNIHMFWDAPGLANSEVINGLYGYNAPAQLCVGVFNRPKCGLVPSTGTATIRGFVYYNNQQLEGAYVSAACQYTITLADQPYKLTVRSGGQYKLIARYEDPRTGVVRYGEAVTGDPSGPPIQPSAIIWRDIVVTDPPACMRHVVVQGIIRCDDVYATGSDNDQQAFKKTLYVQAGVPVFDTSSGTWNVDTSGGQDRLADNASVSFSVGDSHASLQISVQIDPTNLSVNMTLTGFLNPGDENMSWGPVRFNVAADQTVSLTEAHLDTGGPFNDRGYWRNMKVSNNPATAI